MAGINRTTGKATDLITFSRASGGTALRKISYGSELVANGDFETDTSGWTVNAGSTLVATGGSGVFTRGGSNQAAGFAVSCEIGKVYLVSIEIVSPSQANGRVGFTSNADILGSADAYADIVGAGIYTAAIIATSTTMYANIGANANGIAIYYDNVSVKEVLFDQPDGTLTLFNHPTNIPRIEYAANGTVKGLLIEEQRENLLTYSEDFTNAYWVKASSSVTGGVIGPDGTASAYDLNGNGGAGESRLDLNVTVSTSTAYTFSTFAKRDQMDWVALAAIGFTTPGNAWAHFDLLNGTTGIVDAGLSASIQDFGNGWYRCSITFTTDAVDTSGSLRIHIAEGDGDRLLADEALSSVLVYGAQFEAGSFPTSYISTSGSAATRAADIASISVDNFGYRQDAGTVVVGFAQPVLTGAATSVISELSDGSGSNRNLLYVRSDSGTQNYVLAGGLLSAAMNSPTLISAGVQSIVASSFKENDFISALDGGLSSADTSGSVPIVTSLSLGVNGPLTGGQLNGHIKSVTYYPRRLSNAQLVQLTA